MKDGLVNIPNKPWFKVDEVCTITGVKEYILKFWEKEFEQISPDTNPSYESLYSQEDVQVMLLIKDLLFNRKMTIDEAKLELATCHLNTEPSFDTAEEIQKEEQEEKETDERITELSKKLCSILSITDSIKSTHNWS